MNADLPSFQRRVEVVERGFASPNQLTGLPGKLSGCLYRPDGSKVSLSERFGGYFGDWVVSDNPEHLEPPRAARRLSGRGLYLGHFMGGHYGHFITEGLSSFWIFESEPADAFDYLMFHPFTFGVGQPDYVKLVLDRFGLSDKPIMIVGEEPIAFEEVVVPERLFRLNHSADPHLRWVYDRVRGARASRATKRSRLYISRKRFSRRQSSRVIANEGRIERLFMRHGFDVIYPERTPFDRQLELYSDAAILAGISGSGLHNVVFLDPGSTVIELGDGRYHDEPAPTQALCNHVAGAEGAFIPFSGRRIPEAGVLLYDLPLLQRQVEAILPDAGLGPKSAQLGRTLLDALDAAYLVLRPSVAALARRLRRPGRRVQ
jgi:hypothetical protein